jgi:hypothetical protein
MSEQNDLSRHFAAIVGRDLIGDVGNDIVVRDVVGVDHRSPDGSSTSRDIGTTGNSTKSCRSTGVLTIGGSLVTGEDGTTERLLSEFHCGNEAEHGISIVYPIVLVATPRSRVPVFVTTTSSLTTTARRGDVRMRFATWGPDGRPAPRVSVAWHCLTAYEEAFTIDG